MSELLIHAAAWNSNAGIMLSEKNNRIIKAVRTMWLSVYEVLRQAKQICSEKSGQWLPTVSRVIGREGIVGNFLE